MTGLDPIDLTNPIDPIDLFACGIRFGADGGVTAGERRMDAGSPDTWQLAAFQVETDADVHADHWEMHPEGDELVSVLRGGARLFLRPETADGQEEAATLTPGTAVIVPRGRWHRLEVDGPTELMSLTPRRGTRLEPVAQVD